MNIFAFKKLHDDLRNYPYGESLSEQIKEAETNFQNLVFLKNLAFSQEQVDLTAQLACSPGLKILVSKHFGQPRVVTKVLVSHDTLLVTSIDELYKQPGDEKPCTIKKADFYELLAEYNPNTVKEEQESKKKTIEAAINQHRQEPMDADTFFKNLQHRHNKENTFHGGDVIDILNLNLGTNYKTTNLFYINTLKNLVSTYHEDRKADKRDYIKPLAWFFGGYSKGQKLKAVENFMDMFDCKENASFTTNDLKICRQGRLGDIISNWEEAAGMSFDNLFEFPAPVEGPSIDRKL